MRATLAGRAMRAAPLWSCLALLAACGPGTLKGVEPQVEVPARELDFGGVAVLSPDTRPVVVKNVGRAALRLSSVFIEEQGTPFSVAEAPAQVEAASEVKLAVTFDPPKHGDYTATLHISSDDLNEPEIQVSLKGSGSTQAKMEIAPVALDFGVVGEGQAKLLGFQVKNSGTANLVLDGISKEPGFPAEFDFVGSTTTPVSIDPGKAITLTVKYAPLEGAAPESNGAVRISGNDPDQRSGLVNLHGLVNRAPVPVIAPVPSAAPGMTVTLDGTGSYDPDNSGPLSAYAWKLRSKPLGSIAAPASPSSPVTTLKLDFPGQYVVELMVKDAVGLSSLRPASLTLVAKPAQDLYVELVWNNLDTDMDLHLDVASAGFYSAQDCYYSNPQPNFGSLANSPVLAHDALRGPGPELISFDKPNAGTFGVMVAFYSDHQSRTPATEATVRVYEFGVVKAEMSRVLPAQGLKWSVLTIDWPSGTITPVDTVQ